jgi:hypothetical protein
MSSDSDEGLPRRGSRKETGPVAALALLARIRPSCAFSSLFVRMSVTDGFHSYRCRSL